MLKVKVVVYPHSVRVEDVMQGKVKPVTEYVMNHDDAVERRRLGQGCRDAFEFGQMIVTYPVGNGRK